MKELRNCKILLVDDTKTNIDVLIQALRNDYKLGVALNGTKAIEFTQKNQPDLILLDILMPGLNGFEVCRLLKEDRTTRHIPIIFITAMDSSGDKTKGFEIGAVDYIIKPFDITEVKARVRTHLSLKIAQEALKDQNVILEDKVRERTRELEEPQAEILERLGLATEYRDVETGNHIKRISRFCAILGKAAGLPPREYNMLSRASTMHDVGKIGIADGILQKPGKLTADEYEKMKSHTRIGGDLLAGSQSELLQKAEIIALTHHEKWDGSGYCEGRRGEDIPLLGRITCICDVFDALISARPYKNAWPIEKAFEEIRKGAGSHFDPKLVELFLSLESDIRQIAEELK